MSSEAGSGIDAMRARIARGRRQPPRPRRPGATGDAPHAGAGDDTQATDVKAPSEPKTPETADSSPPPRRPAPRSRGEGVAPRGRAPRVQERLSPSLPAANLAIRVRRPLDDRLADAIHELRRGGVRTSKVELVEMLLWELDTADLDGLRKRIARFRRAAPRAATAEFEA